jgi:hypothetical protein
VIPLTLTMQTQPVNTITKIDKTIPNFTRANLYTRYNKEVGFEN